MKKILILLALATLCASASAKKPQTISAEHLVTKNVDGVWHGWQWDDGKNKTLDGPVIIVGDEYRIHGSFVKSVLDGVYTTYDLEDRVREVRQYRSGRPVRLSTYHENGNLKTDTGYDDDGQYHGEYAEYYDDGSVMVSVRYVNGKTEGDFTVFYPDGSLRSVTPTEYGVPDGTVREWDEQGRLTAATSMRAGEIHGERVLYIYNAQNPIKSVETYEDGEIYGDRTGYYIFAGDTTTLAYRYRYDGDEIVSAEIFDTDGNLESMQEYADGKPSVWTYYSQGVLTGRIEYDSDMVGHSVYYYPDGKLWRKGLFVNGRFTEETEYDRDGNIIRQSE